jgi:ring-1,2-phenylacetyl-CoA epoxidase subunit PaaE
VKSVDRETRDAVCVAFSVPPALADVFRFTQGQHLTLRAIIDGADLRRSYSICSAVQDDDLRIAVKHAPGGVFSGWVNTQLKAGQVIEVMPPLGHFNCPLAPGQRNHYLAFAAGSGITPVLSLIKTTLFVEPRSRFTLIYGNRASSTVIFRDALGDLKDCYLDRLTLVHIMSREHQEIELFNGRITREKCEQLFDHWIAIDDMDTIFVCGPEAMMRGVSDALLARGVEKARIKVELFASSIPVSALPQRREPEPGKQDCLVTLIMDGRQRQFTLQRGRESILDAGLRHGIDMRYSCKGGVCSTCRAKLTHGEVDMDANFALEDYEIARGFILTCQSHPIGDRVGVDFDQEP